MTNIRAAHFGRAIQLTIKYGSELEQLHHQYNDALLTELRGAGIDDDVIDNYMKCIRNERFFSIHGFQYVQQLVEQSQQDLFGGSK